MDKGGNNQPPEQEDVLTRARAEMYEERLRNCEKAWRAGNLPAVVDAIEYCVLSKHAAAPVACRRHRGPGLTANVGSQRARPI